MSEIEPTEETPGRGQTRGGNGRFLRSLDTAKKDMLAAELRARSMTYAEIATRLEYSDASAAAKAVNRALAAVPAEAVAELRAIEAERLDAMARRIWAVLDTKYPLTAPDREFVGKDGAPVPDPRPIIAAVDRLLRISEQRRRLLGLDVPAPKAPGERQGQQDDVVDGEIVRLLEQVARRALEAAGVSLPARLALPVAVETPREAA